MYTLILYYYHLMYILYTFSFFFLQHLIYLNKDQIKFNIDRKMYYGILLIWIKQTNKQTNNINT